MSTAPPRPRALVVDDDDVALLVCALLARASFDVDVACDGAAARRAIATTAAPDVVLLDMQLPDATGTELLAELRMQPGWQTVPVLILTASLDAGAAAHALAAGADDWLAKPFRPAELVDRVLALLPAA